MAHVTRLLCGVGQHQEEEWARKGKPNQCGCFFSHLWKGLGLAQTEKEHLGFLFCANSLKYHSPDSRSFEHQEETSPYPPLTTSLSLNPTLTKHSWIPTWLSSQQLPPSPSSRLLHLLSHMQIYKVSKCSWVKTFSSTSLILRC